MPVVANYELFTDNNVLLTASNSEETFDQQIGNTPVMGEGAVLMWKARVEGGNAVRYRVIVNTDRVIDETLSEENRTSLHEVLETDSIHAGHNSVRFVRLSGASIRISDVLILYRHNV